MMLDVNILNVCLSHALIFTPPNMNTRPQEFFDAADELGFLCDPEFAMNYGYPTAWGSPVTPAVKDVFTRSFASNLHQLSHHPSIFGWVLSNEIVWGG